MQPPKWVLFCLKIYQKIHRLSYFCRSVRYMKKTSQAQCLRGNFGGEGGIRPTASTIVLLSDSLQASPASLTRASNLPPETSLHARSPHGFESPFSYFEQNKRSTTLVMLLLFGGEGGIRTLETLLGFIRFPVVRARPGYATSP